MAKLSNDRLDKFRPQTRNANKHTQRGMGALEAAMRKYGYVAPMTAAADGEILDGSARIETSANVFGDDVIVVHHDGTKPVIMVRDDIPHGDTPQAREISIAANRIAQFNLDFDPEVILGDLQAGVDLEQFWRKDELDELLADLQPKATEGDTPAEIDRAEELRQKWGVKPGDLWECGAHRIVCGDCTDAATVARVMGGEKAQGVFTSPPYAEQRKETYGGVTEAQYVDWWEGVQNTARSILADNGSFFVNIKPHCDDGERVLYVFDLVLAMKRRWGWRYVDELCWVRTGIPGNMGPRFKNEFEPIYHFALSVKPKFVPVNVIDRGADLSKAKTYDQTDGSVTLGSSYSGKGGGNVRSKNFDGALPGNVLKVTKGFEENPGHGAIFPVGLPDFFIRAYSDAGDIWVDTFCGSGTTLIAADNNGRRCFGFELLPKYCAVILERWSVHTSRQPVLIDI